jgi:serine/threonine protein kinase
MSEAPTMAPGRPLPFAATDDKTSADSTAEPAAATLPPELLQHPRYRVLALLGSGGMGAVYKAEHLLMKRVVALKVMNRAVVGSAATVERFRREFRASARLAHPNIVRAYDAEQAGDLHFLVMEYVEGTDLARWLAERGPLPAAEACEYVRQAALGLQHAHEHGMIHRDIKPHNLMRTPDGTVKILDFGLARLAAEAGSALGGMTGQGTLLGTVDYLAPEQADDARQADIRSDIYSLGCTLYHLLSGRPPFPQGTVVQKIMAHTNRLPASLRELRPDLPPGLADVVGRTMAKSPKDRYQTPGEVAAALEPFTQPSKPRDKKPGSKRGWLVAATVLFAGLVAAAGGVVFYVKTDNGTIEIQTDDENVKIIAERNGKQVTILDPKSKQTWVVDTGEWTVRLDGNPDGLKLEMPNNFALKRGDKQVVTVKRVKGTDVAVKPPAEEKPGEVRRIAWPGVSFVVTTAISSDDKSAWLLLGTATISYVSGK